MVFRQRFLKPLEAFQRERAQLQRRHMIGLLFDAEVEKGQRFLEAAAL